MLLLINITEISLIADRTAHAHYGNQCQKNALQVITLELVRLFDDTFI